ncbi:hypothetical protein IV203_005401 [Nitzschia inconspicua]|uniref:Uncharacterized protein n=1 Tax=Nitzschia inconspicua TaxID=303405 RepID=A0A9K3PGA8_9STRA|nr:hypothetical protein IV203_005401 [Nitzschia inconspicua]
MDWPGCAINAPTRTSNKQQPPHCPSLDRSLVSLIHAAVIACGPLVSFSSISSLFGPANMTKKKGGKGTSPTGGRVDRNTQAQELAFQKYHGSGEDSHGLAEKFMNGIEMLEGIYHGEMNRVTQRSEKVLDTIYHLKYDKRIVSDPNSAVNGINLTTLTAKTSTYRSLITGRTIWEKRKRVQAAGRKVLDFLDPNSAVNGINLTTLTAKTSTYRSLITGRTIWEKRKRVQAAGRKVLDFLDPNSAVNGINLTTLTAKTSTYRSLITGRTIWEKESVSKPLEERYLHIARNLPSIATQILRYPESNGRIT